MSSEGKRCSVHMFLSVGTSITRSLCFQGQDRIPAELQSLLNVRDHVLLSVSSDAPLFPLCWDTFALVEC